MTHSAKYLTDKENLLSLEHGESCYVNWSEDSGGEVWCLHNTLILFEVGLLTDVQRYSDIWVVHSSQGLERACQEIIDEVYSWT